jgi:hypothetical protein
MAGDRRKISQFFRSQAGIYGRCGGCLCKVKFVFDEVSVAISLMFIEINRNLEEHRFARKVDVTSVLTEALVLEETIRLYYDTRVLRVTTSELLKLRQLAWLLAVQPVIRRIQGHTYADSIGKIDYEAGQRLLYAATEEQFNVSMLQIQRCETTFASASKPEMCGDKLVIASEISEMIKGGIQLQSESTAAFKALTLLSARITECMEAALKANTTAECENAIQSLTLLSTMIGGIPRSFAWARVKSVYLREQKQELMLLTTQTTIPEDAENVAANSVGSAVYCWCQREDDGSAMIQCDNCDEWFHYSCACVPSKSKKKKRGADEPSDINAESYFCISCCESRNVRYAFENQFS